MPDNAADFAAAASTAPKRCSKNNEPALSAKAIADHFRPSPKPKSIYRQNISEIAQQLGISITTFQGKIIF